jgi:hypothetical protein
VKIALAKLVTRREAELRSTSHGATFQRAVYEFVSQYAQRHGDVAEDTGNSTGRIKNCKIGDAVITLGPDCAAAGARIVLEAKEEGRVTVRAAQDEIEQARKNRDAQHGIFVFSKRSADGLQSLTRLGHDVIVVWDAEDPLTDSYLQAALEICRALCVRAAAKSDHKIDFGPIDESILKIEKHVKGLEDVRKFAETIKNSSQKILDRTRIDQDALNEQLALLRSATERVRQALGESETTGVVSPSISHTD